MAKPSLTKGRETVPAVERFHAMGGGAGGASTLSLINRIALAAPAAAVDFTLIPATFENLVLRMVGKSGFGGGAGNDICLVTMNNDGSSGNYNDVDELAASVSASGAVTPTGQNSNLTGATAFVLSSSVSAAANAASYGTMYIPKYARTTYRKLFTSHTAGSVSADHIATGRPSVTVFSHAGVWNSTAAINRLTFKMNSGSNFLAGTVFDLYGES